jgi:hypothetical protein
MLLRLPDTEQQRRIARRYRDGNTRAQVQPKLVDGAASRGRGRARHLKSDGLGDYSALSFSYPDGGQC